ncbi:hypothetical protein [Agromyces sp. NPDC058126]|uniref:hypothetical protein n=1 Tax=Agromyces sp. NPDC058126 TaxID=3346350 RepID=UPI0036D82128
MRPKLIAGMTATLLLVTLTACTGGTPTPTPSATPTPSPEPVVTGPLTCDELVPAELVATTLEGADGVPVEPVAAVNPSDAVDTVLLEGAGGLSCSWRVGSGMPDYSTPSDWAYLRVQVLPDAAGQWVPIDLGEAPSTDTRQIAGIEASVAAGDPGWMISAPVGDAWVVADVSAAGLTGSGSRFLGIDGRTMVDRVAAVSEAAYTTIAATDPARLELPTVALREGEAICNGGLDEQGIVAAEQLPADASTEYTMIDWTTAPFDGFEAAVRSAARVFNCDLEVDGMSLVRISTARGFAPLFDRLLGADVDTAFEPLALADAPDGTQAVVRRYDDGPASPVFLAVGETLYQVSGDGASAVAQAIVAQTY